MGSASALLAAFLAGLLIAGCSYTSSEPGLFDDGADSDSDSDRDRDRQRIRNDPPAFEWPNVRNDDRRTNANLPVAGEEVWTTADGTHLSVRVAVHAVRRIEGATVLDWSITPLGAPGLGADDVVPSTVDLGLRRFDEGNTNLFLIDAKRRELYRPLVHRNISRRCLCTPIWRAQRSLRIGQTAMLQVGFPELPPDVTTVDVDVATVPVFAAVPVTPVGQVPSAVAPTELNRAPDGPPAPEARRLLGDTQYRGQRFRIEVVRVVAREHVTSLQWVITSLSAGTGLEEADGLPFADPSLPITYNRIAASGPRLETAGVVHRASLVSSALTSEGTTECLCSDLRIWAKSLRDAGRDATVITNFPALPVGVEEVTVRLPGVGARQIPVDRGPGLQRSGAPLVRPVAFWQESESPRGWSPHAWPTLLPDSAQLVDYVEVRDRLLR